MECFTLKNIAYKLWRQVKAVPIERFSATSYADKFDQDTTWACVRGGSCQSHGH